MKELYKTFAFSILPSCSTFSMVEDKKALPFTGETTGNVGLLSSYNLRGITNAPENSDVTM